MRDRLEEWWELGYPYLLGGLVGFGASYLPVDTPTFLLKRGISLSSFYASLFNLNTFGSGAMISVFVFTMAPAAGFIGKLEKLKLYKTFRRYAKESILLGVAAGILCMPLTAATAETLESLLFQSLSVCAVALSVGFISAAFRVVRIFSFWASQN